MKKFCLVPPAGSLGNLVLFNVSFRCILLAFSSSCLCSKAEDLEDLGTTVESIFDDEDIARFQASLEAEADASADREESSEDDIDQMTSEWWDVHYSAMFKKKPFDMQKPEDLVRYGDVQEWKYHNHALQQVQELLDLPEVGSPVHERRPVVVVLGCGLAPLVFLIGKLEVADVHCVDISAAMVNKMQEFSDTLPRSIAPSFHAADLTKAAGTFPNGTVDFVVDETVLDSMACVEPRGSGAKDQGLLLESVRKWLRPDGKLLTLSYLPLSFEPHSEPPFDQWLLLQEREAEDSKSLHPYHAALWKKRIPGFNI